MRISGNTQLTPMTLVRQSVICVLSLYLLGHLVEMVAVYVEDGSLAGIVVGPSPLGLPAFSWGVISAVWLLHRKQIPVRNLAFWMLISIIPIFLQLLIPWSGAITSLHSWYGTWVPDSMGMMLMFFTFGAVFTSYSTRRTGSA